MATAINVSTQYNPGDVQNFIAEGTLPLAQRRLVAFQFADPEQLPPGRGVTWTATRYNRLALPFQPLAEGVPPPGQTLTFGQVTVTLQQWGSQVVLSDVAELTIDHPLMEQTKERVALQISETFDRNTWAYVFSGITQVNYANSKGSRAALLATDVLNQTDITRCYAQLANIGAPMYDGVTVTDEKFDAHQGGKTVNNSAWVQPHYVAMTHPFPVADFTQNSTFVLASSYSAINQLYQAEIGQWHGVRFCQTNMCPFWTGAALVTGTPSATGGTLATTNYFIKVTGSDNQNQYESEIHQVSGAIAVTGPTGSISVTLPSTPANQTFSIYIGTTSSPVNLALTASGPTSGPLSGQAVQLLPGATVVLTGIGAAQVPPAAPATGVTVYPVVIIGKGAYAQVVLDDVKITWLGGPDKADVLNQTRVVGWKAFWGGLIKDATFIERLEVSSGFSTTFA